MKSDFFKVWKILKQKERQRLSVVAGLQAFSGLMDTVGVVSIVPFLSLAANPELLQSNTMLVKINNWLQFSDEYFLVLLGLLSLVVLLLNQILRVTSAWYGIFVSHRIWWTLHMRMFRYYLNQPYWYHLQHSGNQLLEKLQVRVNAAVAGVITPYFVLASSFFTTTFILLLLIWVDPAMTLTMIGIMAIFYLLIFKKIKGKLDYYGKINPELSAKSFKLVSEAFGSIKETKVRKNEETFLNIFNPLAKSYTDTYVNVQIYSIVPGGIVELVAFGGILLVTLLMINSTLGFQGAIPLLGMYALALKRILPSIQEAYRQIANIRFFQHSLQVIYPDLLAALPLNEDSLPVLKNNQRYHLNEQIELKELSFTYPESNTKALDSISLCIPVGSLIGIAGASGAGKTTLVDLILGLFEPSSGSILLDGKTLNDQSLPDWQACLGYVPQINFIADDTITTNITFGIPECEVDMQRVKESARIAQISEFIESELPRQYDTLVGERGVRLSGGQRQRLGIARAFYHDPDVLILDEATSALDGITEKQLMDFIKALSGQKTVILIAHRLTTLQECDIIYLIEEGKLIEQGRYQFLMDNNLTFRRMAREESEVEKI